MAIFRALLKIDASITVGIRYQFQLSHMWQLPVM